MMVAQRFRVNAPNVVHEIIEGEAVIVNLSNGMYYSVERAGADIWALLESATPLPEIVTTLADRYSGDRAQMADAIEQFIAQLGAESLIVLATDPTSAAAATPLPPLAAGAYKPRFETPILQRYSDMEDLLLLDPVHEVSAQGWPQQSPPGAPG